MEREAELDLEAALVAGTALRCTLKAKLFEAGIMPCPELLEDRSALWTPPLLFPPEEFDETRKDTDPAPHMPNGITLVPSPWPPLHIWVGALLYLLMKSDRSKGFLLPPHRPPIEVRLTESAKAVLQSKGRPPGHPSSSRRCSTCPYSAYCDTTDQ